MNDAINLKIPYGYEIIEKEQTIKIDKALDLLLSGKQSEYSKAINHYNGTATLYCRVVKCPYCGNEVPINYISHITFTTEKPRILSRDAVARWAAGQASLLEEEKQVLTLNKIEHYSPKLCCPGCGRESVEAKDTYDITVVKSGHKIKLSRKISDINELFQLRWIDNINLTPPFVCYESLVFNLKNGHTYIQLENQSGLSACTRDLTENPELLKGGTICKLILISQSLRRAVKEKFRERAPFPFCSREITLEKLVLATRFIGFDKSFYKALPLLVGTYKIFPGFKSIAKKMHTASKIPQLYKDLNLPMNKATRKMIFSNLGLMFYHEELKKLYLAVNNIDYFNKILSFRHIYFILAEMNCYPVIGDFLAEAFRYENNAVVMKHIANSFCTLSAYALRYMAMIDTTKKMERNREKWIKECGQYAWAANHLPSVVKVSQKLYISDCEIDGYQFNRLVNTGDYEEAGRELHNCLGNIEKPVIAVKKNNQYIGAIGLDDTNSKILAAKLSYNKPVEEDALLCKIIRKWCKKCNVEWNENND